MFLELLQTTVHYPGAPRPAVDDVTLGLPAGDIGVLIGPSGCGKTTLLRAVAGLERLSGGEIRVAKASVSSTAHHLPPEQRRMGMVFQDYALFPHLSVGDNVAFGLDALPRPEQRVRVAEVLDLVGLQGAEGRYPHELSGGQQQRVALARALAPRPQLLLLDEPFSNLDVELRERLVHELRAILKAAHATALFVTHDQQEAFALGDRIGVMHQGQLHQWDDAYTLYHRPTTRFVANFIGHGVFVPATLEARAATSADGTTEQRVVHTAVGDLVDVAKCPLPSAYPNAECDVLLRADDLVLDDASPARARIVRKAFRGADFLYTLMLDDGLTVLALAPSHQDREIGELVGIRAEVDHVVTFARA